DMPLTFEGTRAAKATLGSGVFMVLDDSVKLDGILQRIAAFFRDESCGQCVPCRVGTVRQEEALHRIGAGKTRGAMTTEIARRDVSVDEGTTILGACAAIGVEIPTLCFLETLHPVNACRICVVELEGARVLAPACSRPVENGMVVRTRSPRVDLSRKLVLEMLG